MNRSSFRRIVLILVLTACLGTLPAWASPATPYNGQQLAELNQLWNLFTSLWGEAGCILDPYGGCGAG